MLLSSSVRPVSMPSFRFWYSACCNSFHRSLARFTAAAPAPQPSPFGSRPFPLAFALGSGYSAFKCILADSFHSLRNCRSVANTSILAYNLAYVNYFFQIFSIFFFKCRKFRIQREKRSEIKRFQTAQDQYSIIPTLPPDLIFSCKTTLFHRFSFRLSAYFSHSSASATFL